MEKLHCSKRVFTGDRSDFGGHQCTRKAKEQIGGKWYCAIHTPAYEARKDAEKHAKWERESKERDAKWKAAADREVSRDRCEADRAALVAFVESVAGGDCDQYDKYLKPVRPAWYSPS